MTTPTAQRWWVHASCTTHPEPDLWTSGNPADKARAMRVCAGCPVRTRCREAGRAETYGIWGGVDRGR